MNIFWASLCQTGEMLRRQGFSGGKFSKKLFEATTCCQQVLMCYHFQFDDPDMVKGFRYKLYSTATEADQLKKEEKVKFPLSCPTTQNVKNPPKAWFGIPKHVST